MVDKSEVVVSAALVSAMHLLAENTEIVKRWTSEIHEVVQSKVGMVQFHALTLLHALRAKDRLAVSKLVSSMTRSKIFHPMAQLMLVRYVAQVISIISDLASLNILFGQGRNCQTAIPSVRRSSTSVSAQAINIFILT